MNFGALLPKKHWSHNFRGLLTKKGGSADIARLRGPTFPDLLLSRCYLQQPVSTGGGLKKSHLAISGQGVRGFRARAQKVPKSAASELLGSRQKAKKSNVWGFWVVPYGPVNFLQNSSLREPPLKTYYALLWPGFYRGYGTV